LHRLHVFDSCLYLLHVDFRDEHVRGASHEHPSFASADTSMRTYYVARRQAKAASSLFIKKIESLSMNKIFK
jgi:hypothetical protein